MYKPLTEQQVIDAILAGRYVSYGQSAGCNRPFVSLFNGKPYWGRKNQPLKALDYWGLVIED